MVKPFIPDNPYCYEIVKIEYPPKGGSFKDIHIKVKHCDHYDWKKSWCNLLNCEIMDECSECEKDWTRWCLEDI